jgi:diguanylate cyclase (GGDEF)-like protein
MDTFQDPATTAADGSGPATDRSAPATDGSDRSMPATDRSDRSVPVTEPSRDRPADPGVQAVAVPSVSAPLAPPSGWSDPQTGTDGPRYWDRLILSESARVSRYKRPATVVLVEIAGVGVLARLWGPRVAEQTLAAAARTLSQEIRTSDHIARLEPIRFGLLLTETSEVAAINFVERARAACERDLQVASEVVGVAFGWASPPKGGDLSDAMALAAQRLDTELAELSPR